MRVLVRVRRSDVGTWSGTIITMERILCQFVYGIGGRGAKELKEYDTGRCGLP